MAKSLTTARQKALAALLKSARKNVGLTQAQLGVKVGRHQPFINAIESGQRRVDVVEFLSIAEAIGFDPRRMIAKLIKCKN